MTYTEADYQLALQAVLEASEPGGLPEGIIAALDMLDRVIRGQEKSE
jgi:hypothetical protein